MHKLIWFLTSALILTAQANSTQKWTEDYGPIQRIDPDAASDEKMRWLYEALFPKDIREALPNETFKSFRVHLKDSYQSFPQPSEIAAKNLKNAERITGTITYVGIVKKSYIYNVLKNGSELTFNVRIHLKNPTSEDLSRFKEKLKEAENLWNESRLSTDFKYTFKFDLVPDIAQAHFSVQILDTTRGPYDQNWGRDWTGKVLAHEVGHMLGLGDEYQTLSGKFDCYMPSIMCTAWSGQHMKHHHYFILRRLVKD